MRLVTIACLGLIAGHQHLVAEELFRYRAYALGTSVASVTRISGTLDSRIKTVHERPANIRELEWRPPYLPERSKAADPLHSVVFSFYDDQLYQVVATYHRDRTEGMTNDDVVEAVSATYGVPLLQHARVARVVPSAGVPVDSVVLAQWEDSSSQLSLIRSTYPTQFQLVLISKTLHPQARVAIDEAVRLHTREAPQRDMERRAKEITDAQITSEKARVVNKAAFKP